MALRSTATVTNFDVQPGEPALILTLLSGVVGLLVAAHAGLNPETGALWIGGIQAVAGLIIGLRTKPWAPGIFTGLLAAVFALAGGYGLHLAPEVTAAISNIVMAVLGFVTRHQVKAKGRVL
jgi:hypothetical protein